MPDANGLPLRSDNVDKRPLMNNLSYDILKDVVTLGFPAAVALYSGLALIWGWGFSEEITATGGLLGTFLGVVLKIAQKRYEGLPVDYDGELIANDPNPDHETFRLEFTNGLSDMAEKDELRLRVVDLLPKDSQ